MVTRIDPSKLHGALDNAMKLGTMEVSVYVCCNHLPLLLLPTSPLYPSTQMNKFLPLCPLNFSSLFPPLSLHLSLSSNAPLSILHHFFPPSLLPPFLCCSSLHSSFPSLLSLPFPNSKKVFPPPCFLWSHKLQKKKIRSQRLKNLM